MIPIQKNKDMKGSWNIAEKYLETIWLNFVCVFYMNMETNNIQAARIKVKHLINATQYYIKKNKKETVINTLLEKINICDTDLYKTAKQFKDLPQNKKFLEEKDKEIIDSMYKIVEEINYIFAQMGSYLPVFKGKSSVESSMEM